MSSFNGWDDTIRLISLEKNSYLRYYKAHRGRVRSMEKNPVQPELFSTSSNDCTVKVWDFRTPSHQATFMLSSPSNICYDPLGLVIAAVRLDSFSTSSLPTASPSSFTPLEKDNTKSHTTIKGVLELLDSRMLDSGPFLSWALPPFEVPTPTLSNGDPSSHTTNHRRDALPNGSTNVDTSKSSGLPLNPSSTRLPIPLLHTPTSLRSHGGLTSPQSPNGLSFNTLSAFSSIQCSPNGESILISTNSNAIMVVDSFSGERTHMWQNRRNETNLPIRASFHPSGQLIATGSSNGNIHIYELASGSQTMLLAPTEMSKDHHNPNSSALRAPGFSHLSKANGTYESIKAKEITSAVFHPSVPLLVSSNSVHLDLYTSPQNA